jgi:hypothetical protein
VVVVVAFKAMLDTLYPIHFPEAVVVGLSLLHYVFSLKVSSRNKACPLKPPETTVALYLYCTLPHARPAPAKVIFSTEQAVAHSA